jgi:hypothetical protein
MALPSRRAPESEDKRRIGGNGWARTHSNVDGLPEYPVPPLRVSNHLRVAPADIQHHGVHRPCDAAPHLNVCYTVVHAHHLHQEGE